MGTNFFLMIKLPWVTKITIFSWGSHKHFVVKPLLIVNFGFAVVSQDYVTRVHEIDVILGNAGLLKCEIPSFVIDFVSVINWVDNEGGEHFITENTGDFLRL